MSIFSSYKVSRNESFDENFMSKQLFSRLSDALCRMFPGKTFFQFFFLQNCFSNFFSKFLLQFFSIFFLKKIFIKTFLDFFFKIIFYTNFFSN